MLQTTSYMTIDIAIKNVKTDIALIPYPNTEIQKRSCNI